MKKNVVAAISIIQIFIINPVNAEVLENNVKTNEPQVSRHVAFEHLQSTHSDTELAWDTHFLIESDYITEGRDNLAGSGLYSLSSDFTYDKFIVTPWLAKGISTDYLEVNLNINYEINVSDKFDVFVGYGYLKSYQDDIGASDHEVNIDLSYAYSDDFQILATLYHSFEEKGLFTEVAFIKSYKLNNTILLDLSSTVGFNSGYVTDGHNGLNYAQLRAHISYVLKNNIELHAFTTYSLAINEDGEQYIGDETLSNALRAGVGLSYRY